jgi:hypothetical protein
MISEGREPRGFRPQDVMNETGRRFSSDASKGAFAESRL